MIMERNDYGALIERSVDPTVWRKARALLYRTTQSGQLESAYDQITFKQHVATGYAVHHELYDIAEDAVVVCVRYAEGTTRGVATTSKQYYLVTTQWGQLCVTRLTSAIARYAKRASQLGDVIRHVRGKTGSFNTGGSHDKTQ
jgi:hypothetical protein